MKKALISLIVIGSSCASTFCMADDHTYTPNSHAPASVMAEHLHAKEEIMTGYRYIRKSYSGLYQGSMEVGANALTAAGYSMVPTSMTMGMLMLDIMYAPTDKLTLMLMPQYMSMDMNMHMPMGMDSMNMGSMGMQGMHMEHDISGFGDTRVSALYELAGGEHYRLIGTLGVSVPTGKVDKKNPDGTFMHYGMQLGSGTWDFMPSVTYTGSAGRVSWGGQLCMTKRLQDDNDSGYVLGDAYKAQIWGAAQVVDWMSFSVRVAYEEQDAISGQYKETFRTTSPLDQPENYGGEFLNAAIGVNTVFTEGNAKGLRLGLEWVTRVQEDYNGYQLGMDNGLVASISYAFK